MKEGLDLILKSRKIALYLTLLAMLAPQVFAWSPILPPEPTPIPLPPLVKDTLPRDGGFYFKLNFVYVILQFKHASEGAYSVQFSYDYLLPLLLRNVAKFTDGYYWYEVWGSSIQSPRMGWHSFWFVIHLKGWVFTPHVVRGHFLTLNPYSLWFG